MRFHILKWVRAHVLENPTANHVLRTIADYADAQGRARPSQAEIAEATGLGERTVRKAIATLEAAGLLTRRERRRRDGSRTSDEFRLALDAVPTRHLVPVDDGPDDAAAPEPEQAELALAATGTACRPYRHLVPDQPARGAGPTTFERAREHPRDSSDPHGSGTGPPAPGVRGSLFSEGRPTLIGLGLSRREAGTMIGRWLRDSGDDAGRVLDAIRRARDAAPHDPIPWITAHLQQPRTDDGRRDRQPALTEALDGLAARLRAVGEL